MSAERTWTIGDLNRRAGLAVVKEFRGPIWTVGELARVSGTVYLHLVSAVDAGTGRVQISNNRGRINGWTNQSRVYGICVAVDGFTRPRLDGKLRA